MLKSPLSAQLALSPILGSVSALEVVRAPFLSGYAETNASEHGGPYVRRLGRVGPERHFGIRRNGCFHTVLSDRAALTIPTSTLLPR